MSELIWCGRYEIKVDPHSTESSQVEVVASVGRVAPMSIPLKLPSLGESVVEGVVSRWFVRVGDFVDLDQSVCEVTTDKIDAEIPEEVFDRDAIEASYAGR